MKVMALALMIRYPVTGIEFKTARDKHEKTIEQKYPTLSFVRKDRTLEQFGGVAGVFLTSPVIDYSICQSPSSGSANLPATKNRLAGNSS